MNINIIASNIELTPSLKVYINNKLGSVSKHVVKLDKLGVLELHVEVSQISKHHHKGKVFRAEANLSLPRQLLRAEDTNIDIRTAIDKVQDKLKREINKYKTRFDPIKKAKRDK